MFQKAPVVNGMGGILRVSRGSVDLLYGIRHAFPEEEDN
jgi:hypothetical protein